MGVGFFWKTSFRNVFASINISWVTPEICAGVQVDLHVKWPL
jgi:hypothetical protein